MQTGYHLFETRDLIKRCATLPCLHKTTPPWFSVHSTSAMVAPCFSFADICIDGECQLDTKDFMDFFTLPYLEVFGAGAWGITQGWLPKLHGLESQVKPTRTLLAAVKLFDMWIWRAWCNTAMLEEMAEIENHFGITTPDCRFIGYWENEASTFSGLPAGVKLSHYLRFGKGPLAYVSNLTKEKRDILLTFDAKALGIRTPVVIDAESDLPLVTKDSGVPLSIEGHDFRVLMITAR